MLLFVVILMDVLAGIEFDLFVPSFSELHSQFSLSPFWVEALLSINFIGYCLSVFVVGGLADRYGRKPVILLGLTIFMVGSILCLYAPFYFFLLLGRFLQGIGIAAPAILSFLVIADAYSLKKQQFFMAMLNGVSNTAAGIAPIIGSYITLYFHWQGNFTALLVLGLITLAAAIGFVPSYKPPQHKETLPLQGYKPLFESKPLMLLMAYIICTFIPYWVFVGMSPLLYLKDLGVSLKHFGYYQGVLALTFALGSVLFGAIIHRYPHEKLLSVARKICFLSFVSVMFVTFFNNSSPLWITVAFLIFIVSQIIPSNLFFPLCVNFLPSAKGKVSAVLQGFRLVFSALSLQIAGYFYQGSFQSIGIIISFFIFMIIVMQFFVLKNQPIMQILKE